MSAQQGDQVYMVIVENTEGTPMNIRLFAVEADALEFASQYDDNEHYDATVELTEVE